MKAIVKSIYSTSPDFTLESYIPENPKCFGLWIEFRAGLFESKGADDFMILVCTPDWLEVTLRYEWGGMYWGRHMLLVLEYDLECINKKIVDYVENCTGNDFLEIAQKIARIAAWEFEDYEQQA